MEKIEVTVSEEMVHVRLDIALLTICKKKTRSSIKILIENGDVLVNLERKKCGYLLKTADEIVVNIKEPIELSLEPSNIPIDIVYEDDYLAVINKAQGMVVHPASGSPKDTLVNALLFSLNNLSSINGVARPGIVHRLDKNTSGLIVIAKTDEAHLSLQKQIATKTAKREYYAIVDGVIKADCGKIITNIDRSKKNRLMMAVVREGGRFAETHYNVLERYNKYTFVDFELKTGRTHQIRVHCKHIGHPIVGDSVYGGSLTLYDKGQLLHAHRLTFTHPITNEIMVFNADAPDYFVNILNNLRGIKP